MYETNSLKSGEKKMLTKVTANEWKPVFLIQITLSRMFVWKTALEDRDTAFLWGKGQVY